MADTQIYLAGTIGDSTVPGLIDAVRQAVGRGERSILLAISSPGGNVYWGTTAYNFLRSYGNQVEIITHNAGQVDSIAGIVYCAGRRRRSVTEARFLIHGVSVTFQGTDRLVGEKDLHDTLTGLQKDRDTIARILSARTKQKLDKVKGDMLNGIILTPQEGRQYGFVTDDEDITDDIFDPAQEVLQIVGPA